MEFNADCTHPVASHRHGTHACYALDKCRCAPCRDANTAYARQRSMWTGEFPRQASPMVDADLARSIVDELIGLGYSLKRIAVVSGVAYSSLDKLWYGVPGRGVTVRTTRATLARLEACREAVHSGEALLADGHLVDGREARLIVRELVARGWSKAEIGRRVTGAHVASLQAAKYRQVQVKTLRALRELLVEPVPLRKHWRGGHFHPKPGRPWKRVERLVEGVGGPVQAGQPTRSDLFDLLQLEGGWVTYTEAADRLGVHPDTIGAWVSTMGGRVERTDRGEQPAVRVSA